MSIAASSADEPAPPGPVNPGPVIALVAGEASGDQLGAALVAALRESWPQARFVGVGGTRMAAAGMECWRSSDELAVMGLFEVLAHLPRLLKLRRELLGRLVATRPDVLIGIDSPDFNLGLERRARAAGIRSIHYVSPTVWAWRRGRVRAIARSTDLVMCLFPFEPDFYAEHRVPARYTGHPMADEIPPGQGPEAARERLGLAPGRLCIALLPGSRRGEVQRLAEPLLRSAKALQARYPGVQFVAPMANAALRALFEGHLRAHSGLDITLVDGQARLAIAAADVVVCASGTAALETMLINRPMVVVYRFSWATYIIARMFRLLKSRFFSLPNVLAGQALVPELAQHQVNPERVAREVARWVDRPQDVEALRQAFDGLHRTLRRDAARSAAGAVRELVDNGLQ